DIGAIAAALNLFLPIPAGWMIVPIAAGLVAAQLFCSYQQITSIFKWLALALVSYIATAFFVHPHFSAVARGTFVPAFEFSQEYLVLLVAIFGTTITPYLWFWEA